jgi:hypothetical protein
MLSIGNLSIISQLFAIFIAFLAPMANVIHVVVFLLIIDAITLRNDNLVVSYSIGLKFSTLLSLNNTPSIYTYLLKSKL